MSEVSFQEKRRPLPSRYLAHQKWSEKSVAHHRDQLTGLYNKDYFKRYVDAYDLKSNPPLTVVYVDLDSFKAINDTFGHQVGDHCLSSAAQVLKKSFREEDSSDIVARVGGDEFVVLALSPSNKKDLASFYKTINDRLKNNLLAYNQSLDNSNLPKITFSVGFASTDPTRDRTLCDTINRADESMYQQKSEGKTKKELCQLSPLHA